MVNDSKVKVQIEADVICRQADVVAWFGMTWNDNTLIFIDKQVDRPVFQPIQYIDTKRRRLIIQSTSTSQNENVPFSTFSGRSAAIFLANTNTLIFQPT